MKVSMSNREYSKVRKHFKTMFKYGNLTKEVCESEEYLNFEKEEKKRKEARDFVENLLKTMNHSPLFTDLIKKRDRYCKKYMIISKRLYELSKEMRRLFGNKKIDRKTFDDFYRDRIWDFNGTCGYIIMEASRIESHKFCENNIVSAEEYYERVKEEIFKLRRETLYFSNSLIELEREVETIKGRIPELTEKRRKEDAEQQAKEKDREKAKQVELEKLDKKQKVAVLKYRAEAKARELEHEFSNYRYYQDKKSR